MNFFEGKSPNERNKIIAALVLGVLALASLYLTFGRSLFGGSSTTVTVKVSPTPKPAASPGTDSTEFNLPTQAEQDFDYVTTAIDYRPGNFYAPDPGRNIFAFYEPPPPCPDCPTPIPPPIVVPTPTPTPLPPMQLAFVTPQTVYAGSKGFRLEVGGDKFTADTRIYFSQNELPTTFISAQRLVADIPASFIAGDGARQIIVQTPDGRFYSNQIMLTVQAPPKPEFQYVGMIVRKGSNNDTAYFQETGKQIPAGYRLNDVVAGRFRLVSVAAEEAILEDVSLGFRYPLPLFRPPPGTASTSAPPRRGFPGGNVYVPFNPNTPNSTQSIPGIPDNIPRYIPPSPQPRRSPVEKRDEDEDDEDTDN